MGAFWVSLGIVALAEIGDKTQLLALLLAARYGRPLPILAGILLATLGNHLLAGALGSLLSARLGPQALHWILGLSFMAMAAWTLVPDRPGDEAALGSTGGVLLTSLVTFFLAEMGDKTQLATIALAAHFPRLGAVVAGTTCGMMLADAPAVLLGARLTGRLPLRLIRAVAAAGFAVLGLLVLLRGAAAT